MCPIDFTDPDERPDNNVTVSESRKLIPPYLFRTWSTSSRGVNAATRIVPEATLAGQGHESINSIPLIKAKEMLSNHFQWATGIKTEFSSWTSSLLFALQHAMRKADYKRELDVCICVLDTRKLSDVSIYPATSLLRVYEIENKGKLKHEYYLGEYLVHGSIEDSSCFEVVSLQHLKQCGLFRHFSELDEEHGKRFLYRRVLELRSTYFLQPTPVTSSEILSLTKLGALFGEKFALPITVAFLSLRLRSLKDEYVLSKISQGLQGLTIPRNHQTGNSAEGGPMTAALDLSEVKQFVQLLRELCDLNFREQPPVPQGFQSEDLLAQLLSAFSSEFYQLTTKRI